MTRVERIESEIVGLTRSELAALRDWFRRYDAEAWDRQIEEGDLWRRSTPGKGQRQDGQQHFCLPEDHV